MCKEGSITLKETALISEDSMRRESRVEGFLPGGLSATEGSVIPS